MAKSRTKKSAKKRATDADIRRAIQRSHRILAKNVKKFRSRDELSQEKLSRFAGLNASYVGRLERRRGNPELNSMTRLAVQLGVPLEDLLADDARGRK
jgi:transcriptional regulator with XRE-family HTH domain